MIWALGSWPRHQAGKAIEARCDFRWRGGRLTISRRIWPARTAASFAAMMSKCQFAANGVRGLSSWKRALRQSSQNQWCSDCRAFVRLPGLRPATLRQGQHGAHRGCSAVTVCPAWRCPGLGCLGHLGRIWRRKRATISSCTTSGRCGQWAGSAVAPVPAFFSTSRSMSNSILVARRSASADLLTIWVMIASRLVILRRCSVDRR